MTSRALFSSVVGMLLVACGGTSAGVDASEASIAGTWGRTNTTTQGTTSQTDEAYFVFGADKTVKSFVRLTQQNASVSTSISRCGSGTYVFANGVLSTTIQETSKEGGATQVTTTKTVTSSVKVELVDDSMRWTDADASSPSVFARAALPDGIEASCPR